MQLESKYQTYLQALQFVRQRAYSGETYSSTMKILVNEWQLRIEAPEWAELNEEWADHSSPANLRNYTCYCSNGCAYMVSADSDLKARLTCKDYNLQCTRIEQHQAPSGMGTYYPIPTLTP